MLCLRYWPNEVCLSAGFLTLEKKKTNPSEYLKDSPVDLAISRYSL